MVVCLEQGADLLEQGADLHTAQLMPLPLTVSCFSKIQIGFTSLVPAHLGSPGKRAVKRVCVRVCVHCTKVVGMTSAKGFPVYAVCISILERDDVTLQLSEVVSFLMENFVFTYIGVSLFTFRNHNWEVPFIFLALVSFAVVMR